MIVSSAAYSLSIAATLLLFLFLGIMSGRKIKNAADFSGGKSEGALLVGGTVIGTLVGGSSTIGTAQLACEYGFSAWWFTLGAAAGCLILALFFVCPVRASGHGTIQQIIEAEYGRAAGVITSVLAAAGIGLNIISQLLSAQALMVTMTGLSERVCIITAAVLMACYVLFGGVKGTGLLGIVKSVLLYTIVTAAVIVCIRNAGSVGNIFAGLPAERYRSLFARGPGTDLGAGLSVILGTVSTQTYFQAILAGRTDRTAKKGLLLSALLIPPIGLGCILIGVQMHKAVPGLDPGHALPQFILEHLPPGVAGAALAVLFIAVVGTGAGLSLGMSTILVGNILAPPGKNLGDRQTVRLSRLMILLILAAASAITLLDPGSLILKWGFLSMGLRAAVLLAPMCAALFLPGRVNRRLAVASSVAGVAAVVFAELTDIRCDSTLFGLGVAFAVVFAGFLVQRRHGSEKLK